MQYEAMAQDALRGVVKAALKKAAAPGGLPEPHHLYITFKTKAAGVSGPQDLLGKYPDEMTIVLQHQFWDLSVTDHAIEVGLSFSGVPEKLLIPFDAVSGFFDPSVQFGLKFEPSKDPATGAAKAPPGAAKGEAPELAKLPARGSAAEAPKGSRKPAEKPAKPAAADAKLKVAEPAPDKPKDEPAKEEPKVISLDAFRKKP
jgi:hypothetical protein